MKELQESAAQVAQQLRIPKYVLPDGANTGLGVSKLSLQGEAVTVNKAQIVQ